MKALKIIDCSDPMMWYRNKIGHIVPLVKVHDDCYMSREPAGYLNIVKFEDAKIIEVHDDGTPKAHRRSY